MVVFKYSIENRPGYQQIAMPEGAKVVRLQVGPRTLRKGEPLPEHPNDLPRAYVYLWAIVDQSELPHLRPMLEGEGITHPPPMPRTVRTFVVEMTGNDRPYVKPETYVGSYDDGPHTLHVFEVTRR